MHGAIRDAKAFIVGKAEQAISATTTEAKDLATGISKDLTTNMQAAKILVSDAAEKVVDKTVAEAKHLVEGMSSDEAAIANHYLSGRYNVSL